jgi:hypothetical protein
MYIHHRVVIEFHAIFVLPDDHKVSGVANQPAMLSSPLRPSKMILIFSQN